MLLQLVLPLQAWRMSVVIVFFLFLCIFVFAVLVFGDHVSSFSTWCVSGQLKLEQDQKHGCEHAAGSATESEIRSTYDPDEVMFCDLLNSEQIVLKCMNRVFRPPVSSSSLSLSGFFCWMNSLSVISVLVHVSRSQVSSLLFDLLFSVFTHFFHYIPLHSDLLCHQSTAGWILT